MEARRRRRPAWGHRSQPGDEPRRLRGDTGGAYTIEIVIVLPIVVLALVGVLQAGVWWHGQHVARAAASEGARAARLLGAGDADGYAATEEFLSRFAGAALNQPGVTVARNPDAVTVTVTGTALNVVPGLDAPITAVVSYPVERPRGRP